MTYKMEKKIIEFEELYNNGEGDSFWTSWI